MRVLVTSTPGAGHIHPLLPVASVLRDRGHDVLWATAADGCPRVDRYGFRTIVAGMETHERRALFLRDGPDLPTLPPRERRLAMMPGLFGRAAAPRMRADLVPIVDDFGPDVVVHDVAEFAGPPVAASRGIPHVTVAFSGMLSERLHAVVVESVADVWAAEGLPVPDRAGLYDHLYLHPFPPGLGPMPAGRTIRSVRPLNVDGATTTPRPDWTAALGSRRPAVYVTFGTEASMPKPWRLVLDAVAGADVDVVATLGTSIDPESLGTIPANVRTERYVPQSFVLDRVRAVLSHGGAGTLVAAAMHGVPQLCVPLGADQWDNSDALAAAGAGLTVEPDQRDPATMLAMLGRMLDEPHFTTSARALASEFYALPHPADHAAAIEALASA
jgi:UDP:flavonoid glycosyltransferase YjiC (YdhE family)